MKVVTREELEVACQQVYSQYVSGDREFDDYAENLGRTLGWGVVNTWQEALARYNELLRLAQHGG